MKRLMVTCSCGQRMQVPRSAYGKVGLCPKCGRRLRISSTNTAQMARGAALPPPDHRALPYQGDTTATEALEGAPWFDRFEAATAMMARGEYDAALSELDMLIAEYPGQPNIETARLTCLREKRGNRNRGAVKPPLHGNETLDEDLVKRVLADLMIHGTPDEVRVRAVELAARILGMGRGTATKSKGNGHSPAYIDKNSLVAALMQGQSVKK